MKKRFTSEEQILKAIDKCHERSREFYKIAEAWDAEATALFQQGERTEYAAELRLQACAKRTRAFNMVHIKAVALGEKLSEFRTGVLTAVTTDTSVQA